MVQEFFSHGDYDFAFYTGLGGFVSIALAYIAAILLTFWK